MTSVPPISKCSSLLLSRNVAVAGIPKTIDNDVDYIDHSFGFGSAVEAAQVAIRSAKTEAVCNLPNGIGIVKLMGRSAGKDYVRGYHLSCPRSLSLDRIILFYRFYCCTCNDGVIGC